MGSICSFLVIVYDTQPWEAHDNVFNCFFSEDKITCKLNITYPERPEILLIYNTSLIF